ncbi:MFS family permease [Bacillus mesophilus]|uniref:MFS transporter n=1 Tax=Bacillus mesophilus TaxID=1808955 RepID=A0A6M0Q3W1_9BACI|nr:MFS transporter [Bacillus mesophilus]MBM7660319.1 MFS family permease [Bacillus mesophilus]NEY71031.1 MFS transporter [Bacillus mesophilus]
MRLRDWDLNLKVRLYGEFFVNVLFWMFFPFMAIYFSEEFGKDKAGLLLILSQVFGVLANLVGGYCADHFGRKRMMVISTFGQGVFFLIFAFANSMWMESALVSFICFTVIGVFGSLYWPASQAMVADVVEEKNRNSVFAIFYTGINIAVVIGPIVGGIFFFQHRFELLLTAALTSFVIGIILQKMVTETAPSLQNQAVKKTEKVTLVGAITQQVADYKIIFQDKIFLLFIIAGVVSAQTFMQLDLLMAVYTKELVPLQTLIGFGDFRLELGGEKAFGLIIAFNGFMVALLTVVITRQVDKYRERDVFITSALLYGVGIFLFGQSTMLWVLLGAMAIFTMAEIMVVGIQQSFVSKLAPEHMRGQYFAAASLRFTIGRTIAPISISLSMWIGYQWTFVMLTVLCVISALIYYYMYQLFEKQKKQVVQRVLA